MLLPWSHWMMPRQTLEVLFFFLPRKSFWLIDFFLCEYVSQFLMMTHQLFQFPFLLVFFLQKHTCFKVLAESKTQNSASDVLNGFNQWTFVMHPKSFKRRKTHYLDWELSMILLSQGLKLTLGFFPALCEAVWRLRWASDQDAFWATPGWDVLAI